MTIILGVLVVGFVALWWRARAAARRAEELRARIQLEAAKVAEEREVERQRSESLSYALAETQARLDRIEGLGHIEDALLYSEQLRRFAERELETARAERHSADARSAALVAEAQAERQRILEQAEARGTRVVSEAEERARQIAGSAYELAQRESELRKVVQALENKVRGYGDAYLIPTSALMDELEERYGFSDVGASLKQARQRVAAMIKADQAATCDYVETNRRETAIAFVIDAFNGKVDTVLASVKHDNFGKLQQKVRDAFLLVNQLGRAFRNARIRDEYVQAQVDVLKWAVAVQELKRREKEEQQALREQMREEERARKEFERAQKEATRDQEVARKAVEKAQRALEQASDLERAKYEAQLAELTERLRAAEERGQRALSMAQQTRAGTVYVISNIGSFGEDVFKIGMTRRLEPEDRVRELGDASVPFAFDIHALIRTEDAPTLERELHKQFVLAQVNKVNPRKEFFRLSLADIRGQVERMGIQASWTMTAACQEWRESRAVEARLAADRDASARWEQEQVQAHDRFVERELVEEDA